MGITSAAGLDIAITQQGDSLNLVLVVPSSTPEVC